MLYGEESSQIWFELLAMLDAFQRSHHELQQRDPKAGRLSESDSSCVVEIDEGSLGRQFDTLRDLVGGEQIAQQDGTLRGTLDAYEVCWLGTNETR
jgi:hypothetical protein